MMMELVELIWRGTQQRANGLKCNDKTEARRRIQEQNTDGLVNIIKDQSFSKGKRPT